ncbi:MAG: ABC transporter ATP-binding protein [Nitrospirae bacterium]|nr:MAG: ABC transporter ATP-binding protein [Nitrospirota bacterium]
MRSLRDRFHETLLYRVLLARYGRNFALGVLALLWVDAIEVALPLLIREAVDGLVAGAAAARLGWIAAAYLALILLQAGGRYAWRMQLAGTSFRCDFRLRQGFVASLVRQGPDFYQRHPTGDLMSRATNDLSAVRFAVGPGVVIGMDAIVYFLVLPPILLWLSPSLTAVVVAPMVAVPFFVHRMRHLIAVRFRAVQAAFSALSGKVQESLAGIRVVKGFELAPAEVARFDALGRTYVAANVRHAVPNALFSPVLELTTFVSLFLLLLVGGGRVIAGSLTVGTVVAFQRYLSKLTWPMTAVGWSLSLFQRGATSLARVDEVVEAEPSIPAEGGETAASALPVVARGLGFTYPGATRPALEAVELRVEPGEMVAIVGPVGGGKSTLLACLARLHPVAPGQLAFGGLDATRWDPRALRRRLGVVPQEPFLFSRSIAENIAYGRPGADRAAVERAAEAAAVAEEIRRLPGGFDARLGERGVNLSGGQRQRITLARALLREPELLLLDDCLSAVDVETERRILETLRHQRRDRTLIFATHRLQAVVEADQIWVMRAGRIVERGRHEALLAAGGVYTRLWRRSEAEAAAGDGRREAARG